MTDISAYSKDLERRRDALINDLKSLEERHNRGEIDEEEYKEKRRKIERDLVEVMDHLAQTRFIMGQHKP